MNKGQSGFDLKSKLTRKTNRTHNGMLYRSDSNNKTLNSFD